MKLCIYNVTATTHFGGLETYAWELGKAMAERGHTVEIVAGEGGPARNEAVRLVTFSYTSREKFPKFGTRFRKLMERLSFARQALPYMRNGNFDAIIINKPYDMPALWLGRRQGMTAKTLFRSGGTDFFSLDRWFSRAIDHWVSTSRYNARQITEHFATEVQIVPNGVDVSRFRSGVASSSMRQRWQVPAAATLVVSVGRLVGWKGLHIIIEAIKDVPNIHYLIVGQGEERHRLEKMASDLGVANRVHFAGLVTHADLPEVLQACDIFVQPSIGEEAFGISVVEAMAAGLAVVLSRNGGMVEIVADQVSGLLRTPGQVDEWRQALRQLSEHPELRKQLATAGKLRVHQAFTWEANALAIETILSSPHV